MGKKSIAGLSLALFIIAGCSGSREVTTSDAVSTSAPAPVETVEEEDDEQPE